MIGKQTKFEMCMKNVKDAKQSFTAFILKWKYSLKMPIIKAFIADSPKKAIYIPLF